MDTCCCHSNRPCVEDSHHMLTVRNEARRENVYGYTKEGDSLCLEE